MPTRFTHLAVDSADMSLLGRFWADLLDWPVAYEDHEEVYLEAPDRDASVLGIVFVPVPEPKTVKNRIHWDVRGDVEALEAHGATRLWEMPRWVTLADPEGNEFCVFE